MSIEYGVDPALSELAAVARSRPSRRELPEYPGIVSGARVLRQWAACYTVGGILVLLLGAVGVFASIRGGYGLGWRETPIPGAILCGAIAVLCSMWFFNKAAVLRLLADVALAQRDIARNSFSRSS